MTCPNCSKDYYDINYCPHCKVDAFLYDKVIRVSDSLYNEGLSRAKVQDFSGAMHYLSKSIAVNKNNVPARNLLGLIQYETGLIGDAAKNWVISCGLLRENNPAQRYLELFRKNGRFLDRLNDAVCIYNLAIKDVHQKSEDMAIIKLKQATDLNPKFVNAFNLLALCYMNEKENDKAIAVLDKALAIDANNTTSLRYYAELNPARTNSKSSILRKRTNIEPVTEPSAPYKKVTITERRNSGFNLAGVISLVIGVVLTVIVGYVLVIPAMARSQENQLDAIKSQLAQVEQAYEYLGEEKEAELEAMQVQVDEYRARESDLASEMDVLNRSVQILAAFDLLRENRLREAVDSLGNIDIEGLPQDIAARSQEIRNVAYPHLADQLFREGLAAYNGWDFEKARIDFERAYRYVQHIDNEHLYIEVVYYIAWTFSMIDEYDLAIQYFERLIENFPNSPRVPPSRNRINAISQ